MFDSVLFRVLFCLYVDSRLLDFRFTRFDSGQIVARVRPFSFTVSGDRFPFVILHLYSCVISRNSYTQPMLAVKMLKNQVRMD
ncbi:hypothetical protein HanXRQr2_Chr15g0671441 [Helianthus annuus]|uniref:Uncharacterized protein n=1 Tax=Helianthus annuus TaxID=4232 RepID=A0A9K3DYJ0_HELAN|nr:hypothetical protein HanXRQr2_Chr15g0671441 [Helianthus annuus]KAJ0453459.1 hypothetical protein HanIR_Chr15g0729581 [Helianthus annuus]KAJ0829496.1 hypothetical protein HanPSC8_Chr15g0644611 [Helianthus annuus]